MRSIFINCLILSGLFISCGDQQAIQAKTDTNNASQPAAEEPTLTEVKIRYFTPAQTDDKDDNSALSITLQNQDLKTVAALNRCCDTLIFPDNGTWSPTYSIPVIGKVYKTELRRGSFGIAIDPVGNDRWIFRPELTLIYSDRTKDVKQDYSNRIVAQDAKETTFVF